MHKRKLLSLGTIMFLLCSLILNVAYASSGNGGALSTAATTVCEYTPIIHISGGATGTGGAFTISYYCPFLTTYTSSLSTTLTNTGNQHTSLPYIGNPYVSPAAQVAAYNQKNAAWMETCPQTPPTNPTTDIYFVSGAEPFVAGDVCQAYSLGSAAAALPSDLVYTQHYSFSLFDLAHGYSNISTENTAKMVLKDVAYSPQLQSGAISTAYDSNTNIFSGVPSNPQHGLWSWVAAYADFASAPAITKSTCVLGGVPVPSIGGSCLASGYIPYIAPGIGYNPPFEVYPVACTYTYKYTISTTLQSIQNTQIPYVYQTAPPANSKTPGKNATFNTNFLPYILYNFKVLNPSLGNNIYTLDQLSYAAYSPYNYNNPKTSEIPINISTPQIFMASYNTNKYQQNCNSGNTGFFGSIGCFFSFSSTLNSKTFLSAYAMPNMIVNTMQTEPIEYPALGEPKLYGYGASAQQLATAGSDTPNAMVIMKNPLSIASTPNDYIFVLSNTIKPPKVQTTSSSCTITQPSQSSSLENFIQSALSDMGVQDTTNNEALLAAIAQSYGSTGSDFIYNNPLGIASIQGSGSNGGLKVNVKIPSSPCTAPDGTPEYSSQSQGETATSDAFKLSASANGATLATFNALMYGLKNNEPLSYYTTNSVAESDLLNFGVVQSVQASSSGSTPYSIISGEISSTGSASSAASSLVSWAQKITGQSINPQQPSVNNYAGATNSIYIMRVMNTGYYNNTILPPNTIPNVVDTVTTQDTALLSSTKPASSVCSGSVSCQNVWNSDWKTYWTSLIKLQSANTYVIQQIPLTPAIIASQLSSAKSTYNSQVSSGLSQAGCSVSGLATQCIFDPIGCSGNIGSCIAAKTWFSYASCWIKGSGFSPMNISADSEGNIYIVGVMDVCAGNSPWLIKITGAESGNPVITGTILTLANGQVPEDNNGKPINPTEITVSPDGKLVFIASQKSSNIYVFSGETLKYLNTYNLVYSSDVAPLGITYQGGQTVVSSASSSSSKNNNIPNVNITEFIANGGFYGLNTTNNNGIASIINKFKSAGISQLDTPNYHHPVAIQDVNGYLYVLDNWYGGIGGTCNFQLHLWLFNPCWKSNTANFDTLMLRVINSTGEDVPINPTRYNDIWYQSGTNSKTNLPTYQHYTGNQSGGLYPPFGWMVAGSLSDGTSSSSTIINLCGLDSWSNSNTCAAIPSSYSKNSNYWPLGPAISGMTCNNALLVTIDPNLGAYGCGFEPLSGLGLSISFNNTVGILFISPQNLNSGQVTANKYGELIFTQFNLENYTQFLSQKGPPILNQSVCYMDVNTHHALTLPSGVTNPNLCIKDNNINSFESPILLLSSPFNYTENIGSLKTLTYAEYLSSTFSGTGGTSQQTSSYSATQSKYESELGSIINQGTTATSPPAAISPSQVAAGEQTKLQSFLSGYSVVPYEATFQTQQQIQQSPNDPQVLPTATVYWCFTKPATLPPFDISRTWTTLTTLFSTGAHSAPVTSPALTAPIEGGLSYAQYILNGTFYQQALNATIVPKDLLLNIFSNRIFGTVYANYSIGFQTNKQITTNAIRTIAYGIQHNTQGGLNLDPYYEAIATVPGSSVPGLSAILPCVGTVCMTSISLGSAASSLLSASGKNVPNVFTYEASNTFPNAVTLFNFYQDMVYSNYTFLNFTGNGIGAPGLLTDPYGYHRIVLVLNDRFDNNIYIPMDLDIANQTQVGLTLTPSVDSSNSNQTTLTISGSLNYTPPFSTNAIPMRGGTVYLYYDTNLGFQNYNPYTDPANVQLCAFGFGANVPGNCQLAKPGWLYGGTTPNPNAYLATYQASTGSSGSCLAAPNSLLQPVTYSCNIYGADKLPTTCAPSLGGHIQWCYPVFYNGTGLCTSQLGLIGTATTNANGQFSKTITSCGNGEANIQAVFYGAPSVSSSLTKLPTTSSLSSLTPEPLPAKQSPIAYAYNVSYGGTNDNFYVTDYSWAPTSTQQNVLIGAVLLSYGNIGYIYIMLGAVIMGLLLFATRKTGAKKKLPKRKGA